MHAADVAGALLGQDGKLATQIVEEPLPYQRHRPRRTKLRVQFVAVVVAANVRTVQFV
jgi:hypothetical protein